MSKQISIKTLVGSNTSLKSMYEEAIRYLETIGFKKTPLMSYTDEGKTYRCFLFQSGNEKLVIEYMIDMFEENLKLIFSMEIKFVYDILLMRFNQLANENVFIYNE